MNITYLIIILNLFLFPQEKKEQKTQEQVQITSFSATPDVVNGNVKGAVLTVSSDLTYNKELFNIEKPSSAEIVISFLNQKGEYINAIKSTSNHKDQDGHLVCTGAIGKDVKIFLPYYAIQKKEGKYTFKAKISAFVRDTSITQPPREVKCVTEKEFTFTINKPATKEFKVIVRGARLASTDFKGKEWDWGLVSNAPDVNYKVMMASDITSDVIYSSPWVKNSFSGAWIDYSCPVVISEGDKVTLAVYDVDTLFDDLAGSMDFTYEELKKAADDRTEFDFDRVTYMLIDFKKIDK